MEVTFSELKQKDVIGVNDGKHLGKVCDITFTFPEGKIKGFTVTGGKGFRFGKQEAFIPLKDVLRIGEDAVLVKTGETPKDICPPKPDKCSPPPQSRRSFDEYE